MYEFLEDNLVRGHKRLKAGSRKLFLSHLILHNIHYGQTNNRRFADSILIYSLCPYRKLSVSRILKYICHSVLIICISSMALHRYHHHDCDGDIFFRIISSYEIALSQHELIACEHEAENTSGNAHDHSHSHPCSDDCWLSADYSCITENHKIDVDTFQQLFLLGITSYILQQDYKADNSISLEFPQEKTIPCQTVGIKPLRAPPAC